MTKLTEDIKTEKKVCCICGEEFNGYGNNAEPVANGICCNRCNDTCVVPMRLELLFGNTMNSDE